MRADYTWADNRTYDVMGVIHHSFPPGNSATASAVDFDISRSGFQRAADHERSYHNASPHMEGIMTRGLSWRHMDLHEMQT